MWLRGLCSSAGGHYPHPGAEAAARASVARQPPGSWRRMLPGPDPGWLSRLWKDFSAKI